MRPLADGVTDLGTGFEHDRSHAALEDVSGSGQSDGSTAQDGDRLWRGEAVRHDILRSFLESSK